MRGATLPLLRQTNRFLATPLHLTAIFGGILAFSPAFLFAQDDWRYVPYFDHPEVQECAKGYAAELADETSLSAESILAEANRYNDYFPTMTKASDPENAHLQLSILYNIWQEGRENIRPGMDFSLHEYGQGVLRKCTFEVFDRHYKE